MNFISLENVTKSFGDKAILDNVNLEINEGSKTALVAKNGAGKTTLINLITGKDSPNEGKILTKKGLNIGYLPQEPKIDPKLTIKEYLFSDENPLLKIIGDYQKALENPEDEKFYQNAFEQMETHQAWDIELSFRQILSKLKIENLEQKVETLSGGQKKRVAMAMTLLNKPDLLILDEPTNHLDLEMIEWLEGFLDKEKLTLFMVTHDRYFLECVCNEIVELENKILHKYSGNYSEYLEKKQLRHEQLVSSVDKARNLFRRELEWMRRQPKARTTKSKSRIDSFYDTKKAAHQKTSEESLSLSINIQRLGNKIVEIHKASKSIANKNLLDNFSYNFQPKERLGIIGKNGTGKSTFLKIMTGELAPDAGKIIIGETIKFGFFKQDGLKYKEGQKVIEVIKDIAEFIPLEKGKKLSAEGLLEQFLFERKRQYDYVEKLSGGEKKRLYLCSILMKNPNFLVFDEPTNDLDIVTLNVLENFLLEYPGCLIVVSHDRYFMDKIVNHLFVFEGEGKVTDFLGSYSDWRQNEEDLKLKMREAKADQVKAEKIQKKQEKEKVTAVSSISREEKKELKRLTNQITKLEEEKTEIEAKFLENLELDEIQKLSKKLKELEQDLETKTERWMELEELDS